MADKCFDFSALSQKIMSAVMEEQYRKADAMTFKMSEELRELADDIETFLKLNPPE